MFSSPLSAIGQLQQLEISISTKGYIGKWLELGFVGAGLTVIGLGEGTAS